MLQIPNPKNLVPGFPTLEQLPQTVAETVRPMPVFSDVDARSRSQSVFSPALTAAGIAQAVERDGSTEQNESNEHSGMDMRNDLDVHMTNDTHEQADITHDYNDFEEGNMTEGHPDEQNGLRGNMTEGNDLGEHNMAAQNDLGLRNTAEGFQEHNDFHEHKGFQEQDMTGNHYQHNGLEEGSDMAQRDGMTERNDSVAYSDQMLAQQHGRTLPPWRLPGFKCVFDTQLPFDANRSDAGFGVLREQPMNYAPPGEVRPMDDDTSEAFVNRGVQY